MAGHIIGANITYEPVGGNDYKVTLYVFQNCFDPQIAQSEPVRIIPDCNFLFSSVFLPLVAEEEVTQASTLDLANSTCNGGFLPGVKRLTYVDTLTFDTDCERMRLMWKKCNRSDAININNSDSPCFYVESWVHLDYIGNRSPQLSQPTVPYVCGNPEQIVNLGAFDPDGDQLRYSLVPASQPTSGNNFGPVVYEEGFSGSQPIQGMTLDQSTGNITMDTEITGFYVVALLIEELDEFDQVKGSMLLDIQFVVSSCTDFPPYLSDEGLSIASGNAQLSDSMALTFCPGASFCVNLIFQSDDPDQVLDAGTNIFDIHPNSSWTVTGTNPISCQLCMQDVQLEDSELLIITVTNDDQPIPTVVSYGLQLDGQESAMPDGGPDMTVCGGNTIVSAQSGSGQWSGPADLTFEDPLDPVTTISGLLPGEYWIQWANQCASDSVMLTVNPSMGIELPEVPPICPGDSLILYTNSLTDGVEFEWSLIDGPGPFFHDDSVGMSIQSTALLQGSYIIQLHAWNDLCDTMSTIQFQVGLASPWIESSDDGLQVMGALSEVTYQWYFNESPIPGATEATYYPMLGQNGFFHVEITDAAGCLASSDPYFHSVSGLEEDDRRKMFQVMPNPVSERAIVRFNTTVEAGMRLEVYNGRGQRIYTHLRPYDGLRIAKQDLASGLNLFLFKDRWGQTLGEQRVLVE